MKRFYKEAKAVRLTDVESGWTVELDGRRIMTPDRQQMSLPTAALAQAVADEWNAQGDKIDPKAMPMTGFANAAIDRIAPARADFVADIARYGEADLLCYRADSPAELVAREAEGWDPLLDWAARRYDVAFETITGIVHRPQPDATLSRLKDAVAARNDFELAALSKMVQLGGSLVIALALAESHETAERLWTTACLDEQWQAELWGEDEVALRHRQDREADFMSAARFLELAGKDLPG